MTSAEAVPFAKVGGMADVVGSLPASLREQGHDARVLIPGYGFIEHYKYQISHLFSFPFTHNQGTSEVHVYTTVHDGVPIYFVQAWPYFGMEGQVYHDYNWDLPRFIFFSQMTLAATWELKQRMDWFPDIIHAHDWHTGVVPFLVDQYGDSEPWRSVGTVFSIHNLAYQGNHAGWWMFKAGIPVRNHPHLVYQNLTDNLMAIAIAYSNAVTTVSPRYATEIQFPYQGYGLDGMIRTRIPDLHGILNGIDTKLWDPATDKHLPHNFDVTNFHEVRPKVKRALQESLDLPVRPDIPIMGIVSRLVGQKGVDLLIPAIRRVLRDFDAQFIVLGTGDPYLEYELAQIGADFYQRGARVMLTYNATYAQTIYGGADLFLMPSHFEPCGIGQMLAMRYGALPLVRETGGLADTVENYDGGDADYGTGFVFEWQDVDALYNTIKWAIETYRQRPKAWRRLQERAMRRDFSWDQSARQYGDIYDNVLRKKRG